MRYCVVSLLTSIAYSILYYNNKLYSRNSSVYSDIDFNNNDINIIRTLEKRFKQISLDEYFIVKQNLQFNHLNTLSLFYIKTEWYCTILL